MAPAQLGPPNVEPVLDPNLDEGENLIIVCCHAIWLGGPTLGEDDREWAIEDFQKGEAPTFIEHIETGMRKLREQPSSILVFSGGATKPTKTGLSEAESYKNLAILKDIKPVLPETSLDDFNQIFKLKSPVLCEDLATDSYQNLILSIILFFQRTGYPPKHVTIISHAFKKDRFLSLHCKAARWPIEKVTFIGIDPVRDEAGWKEIHEGNENAWAAWRHDLYGCGNELAMKRKKRGWKLEELLGRISTRDKAWIEPFVTWDGGKTGEEVYVGWLPWDCENPGDVPPVA